MMSGKGDTRRVREKCSEGAENNIARRERR